MYEDKTKTQPNNKTMPNGLHKPISLDFTTMVCFDPETENSFWLQKTIP